MPRRILQFARTTLRQISKAASHLRVSVTMGVLLEIEKARGIRKCRFCNASLPEPFLDLGKQPLANAYVKPENVSKKEFICALRVFFCRKCNLVQLSDLTKA